MKKRMICLVLILAMIGTMALAGCGKKETVGKESESAAVTDKDETTDTPKAEQKDNSNSETGIDISEEVHIVGYLLGSAPAGMDKVMEALNAKLKEKVNATLEIRYLGWSDYTTKYPLVLAAGEDVDFMFTADWCMYAQEANKNAFLEITEEDLQKYMPLHYAVQDPTAYLQGKINGKLYMISTATPDKRCNCLAYRKDLADKYNIKDLNKLSDFTTYFKAIQENETEIEPMYLSNTYDELYGALANECGESINFSYGLCWHLEDSEIKLAPLYEEPYRSSLTYAFNIMKEWYDAGYVNKDIISNTVTSRDALVEGKSAIALGNSVDMQSVMAAAEGKGYDIGVIPLLDNYGKTGTTSYLNSGVGIAATSKNPERTMMVLDLLMEDKEYNYLAYYGVEGENYIVTEDGKIGLPEGVTADTNTYPADSAGFWFTNKDQFLPMDTWTDSYIALKDKIPGMLHNNTYIAFSANIDNIATETANITQVMQQYAKPLQVGMVDDIEKAMKTLEEKLKAAGIETVQKEIQSQTDAFLGQ